jgi:hypothetical protein
VKSICNFGYARHKRGGPHFPNVRNLLKYIQFRDDRDDYLPGAGGPDRWVDGGLGTRYGEIVARLDDLSPANRHAYCHSVIISPDPEAMARVEGDPQARFVEAVRTAIQVWDEWRQEHDARPQAGPIEYSFVVHRPERSYGEQMHAHLILAPATENPLTGEATPLYNNPPQVQAFKEIVYRELDRAFGLEREQEPPEQVREPQREIHPAAGGRDIEFIPLRPGEPTGEEGT